MNLFENNTHHLLGSLGYHTSSHGDPVAIDSMVQAAAQASRTHTPRRRLTFLSRPDPMSRDLGRKLSSATRTCQRQSSLPSVAFRATAVKSNKPWFAPLQFAAVNPPRMTVSFSAIEQPIATSTSAVPFCAEESNRETAGHPERVGVPSRADDLEVTCSRGATFAHVSGRFSKGESSCDPHCHSTSPGPSIAEGTPNWPLSRPE